MMGLRVAILIVIPVVALVINAIVKNFAASRGRSMSPIAAVAIACAGIAIISPFDVVKRTSVPMIGAFVFGMALHLILFV